jgi:hypothetical protein
MLSNATIEENSLIKSNLTGTRLLMDSRYIFLLRFFVGIMQNQVCGEASTMSVKKAVGHKSLNK